MNKSSPYKLRTRLARATAVLLFISAVVLVASSLLKAQSSAKSETTASPSGLATPTATPVPYCVWPPIGPGEKDRVKKAIEEALDESAANQPFRDRLLNCNPAAKCDEPIRAVKEKLGLPDIKFPDSLMLIFYERDYSPTPAPSPRFWDPTYPPNHCFSILDLPPFTGQKPVPGSVFKEHLRCCYDPW